MTVTMEPLLPFQRHIVECIEAYSAARQSCPGEMKKVQVRNGQAILLSYDDAGRATHRFSVVSRTWELL